MLVLTILLIGRILQYNSLKSGLKLEAKEKKSLNIVPEYKIRQQILFRQLKAYFSSYISQSIIETYDLMSY